MDELTGTLYSTYTKRMANAWSVSGNIKERDEGCDLYLLDLNCDEDASDEDIIEAARLCEELAYIHLTPANLLKLIKTLIPFTQVDTEGEDYSNG